MPTVRRAPFAAALLLVLSAAALAMAGFANRVHGPAAVAAVLPATPADFARVKARPDTTEAGDDAVPVARAAFSLDRLMIPVAGIGAHDLVDTYSARRSGGRTHNAIDILAPRGTPVLAASDGTIVRRHANRLGGKVLYLRSPDGRYDFYYAHLDGYAEGIEEDVEVRQGDVLGYVGTTGNAPPNTPHLHFQVLRTSGSGRFSHGSPVNPYPLLRRSALNDEALPRVRG